MHYLATKIRFLDDVVVEVAFQDGKVIQYDMSKLFDKYPQLKELRDNRTLFESGNLDNSGCGIIWNDELDIDTTTIHEEGYVVGHIEPTINQKLGFLLCSTRESLNITQAELAKLSGIDQGDISKIERGKVNPTIAKIDRLFNALGKKIDFKMK